MTISKTTRVHTVGVIPAEEGRTEHAIICVTYVDTYSEDGTTFSRTHRKNFPRYQQDGSATDLSQEATEIQNMANTVWQ